MRGAYSTPEPAAMPPDVVYVKLDAATRHAWIVPEGMVVWAMARAEHPGRTDAWRPEDVRRMVALCRSMIDADLAGENPSPLARGAHHDPQGRLLVDSYGFDRLLDGGLAGPAATLLPSAVAQAMTARIRALSRTPLRRLVMTLATDLERGDGNGGPCDTVDDETLRRSAVGAFVQDRCVRGAESCSADTLYRAFVAWASTTTTTIAGHRPIQRPDFWRAIAVHAAHAFDVGGGAHIVSGLTLSHRTQQPRSHDPAASTRRLSVDADATDQQPPRLGSGSGRDGRSPGHENKREKGQQRDKDGVKGGPDRRPLLRGAHHDGSETKGSTGARSPRPTSAVARKSLPPKVRYDTSGYLAAIDLLYDAMGIWDVATAKTAAGRIMYALRQRGWNFEKRRIGPGRATPLLRAVDVDAFLAASADIAGAGDAALSIAHYAETDAYVQLMTCLGQKRDPLGRRTAAVHARECIAACVAASEAPVVDHPSPSSSSSTSPVQRRCHPLLCPISQWATSPAQRLYRRRRVCAPWIVCLVAGCANSIQRQDRHPDRRRRLRRRLFYRVPRLCHYHQHRH
ncbi:hypothetical protein pclt_cds_484 [Pandoravirus celtis]|uniref:Uncharacterized protein n=1 Tax=Pandoravirus celtis TaxID=2568002 RepID=A0A4D6EHW0_9VIRU|nr:hypothetical protein pclt_cds_484 [Pandoravirus celtis]